MQYLIYHMPDVAVQMLDPEELDATEQAAYRTRGEPFLRERSILRRELGTRIGAPASQVQLTYGRHGKPECAQQPFNLSHSGDYLCIAFHHRDVGVDIERVRPRRHLAQIARRIMEAEQFDVWKNRGESIDEFYACWCAAEALTKLRGGSILHAQEQPFLYLNRRIELPGDPQLTVELFTPAVGYAGAVAYYP